MGQSTLHCTSMNQGKHSGIFGSYSLIILSVFKLLTESVLSFIKQSEWSSLNERASVIILHFLRDISYHPFYKRWLGENFLVKFSENLHLLSEAGINSINVHSAAISLFKSCCGQSEPNQKLTASLLISSLSDEKPLTTYVSRVLSASLSMNDTVFVGLDSKISNNKVCNNLIFSQHANIISRILRLPRNICHSLVRKSYRRTGMIHLQRNTQQPQ